MSPNALRRFFEDFTPGTTEIHGPERRFSGGDSSPSRGNSNPSPFIWNGHCGPARVSSGTDRLPAGTAVRGLSGFWPTVIPATAAAMGAPGIEAVRWLRPLRPALPCGSRQRAGSPAFPKSVPAMGPHPLSLSNWVAPMIPSSSTRTKLDHVGTRDAQAAAPHFRYGKGAAPTDGGPGPRPFPVRRAPAAITRPADADADACRLPFCEDLLIGEEAALGSYVFTRTNIISFARKFDPQPFHLDEGGARESGLRRLCASGLAYAAAWMKCMVGIASAGV